MSVEWKKEREERKSERERERERESKNKCICKDNIRSNNGLKTERQSMQKLKESL